MNWHDKMHQFSISAAKGAFNGMSKKHLFNVVLVNGSHGSDVGMTSDIEKDVVYKVNALNVKI